MLKYDKKLGRPPMISFTEEFTERPVADQISYLKLLASANNHALGLMQKERDKLLTENIVLRKSLEKAQQALEIERDIGKLALTGTNQQIQMYGAAIQELQEEIRSLKARLRDALICQQIIGDDYGGEH